MTIAARYSLPSVGAVPPVLFPFTQQHLADTLGMSLVHTNKTLKRLSASNAICWKDRVFEILDRPALERIAGDRGKQKRQRPFI